MASSEVIIQVLFTSEQPKVNKMAPRFVLVFEKEILLMNEGAVPKNTIMATKFGVTVFNALTWLLLSDNLFYLSNLMF